MFISIFQWPNCQPVGAYVAVKDSGKPVTRKQFAHRVSMAIARMLTKVGVSNATTSRYISLIAALLRQIENADSQLSFLSWSQWNHGERPLDRVRHSSVAKCVDRRAHHYGACKLIQTVVNDQGRVSRRDRHPACQFDASKPQNLCSNGLEEYIHM